MKNRKRESCTSGSVRDEGGNILIYSAFRRRGGGETRVEMQRSFQFISHPTSHDPTLATAP